MPTDINSITAYHSVPLTERKLAVIDLLRARGPMTDKAIKSALNFSRNTGLPTEMVMDGQLEKFDDVVCPETGHLSRRLYLASNPPRHEITLEVLVDGDVTFHVLEHAAEALVTLLKADMPNARVQGTIRIKFGSKTSDVKVAGSDEIKQSPEDA